MKIRVCLVILLAAVAIRGDSITFKGQGLSLETGYAVSAHSEYYGLYLQFDAIREEPADAWHFLFYIPELEGRNDSGNLGAWAAHDHVGKYRIFDFDVRAFDAECKVADIAWAEGQIQFGIEKTPDIGGTGLLLLLALAALFVRH